MNFIIKTVRFIYKYCSKHWVTFFSNPIYCKYIVYIFKWPHNLHLWAFFCPWIISLLIEILATLIAQIAICCSPPNEKSSMKHINCTSINLRPFLNSYGWLREIRREIKCFLSWLTFCFKDNNYCKKYVFYLKCSLLSYLHKQPTFWFDFLISFNEFRWKNSWSMWAF